jgi:hypothetical protein
MLSLRVGTWNIAGARPGGHQPRRPGRGRGRSPGPRGRPVGRPGGRPAAGPQRPRRPASRDRPGLGADWFWSFAPALVGDDFRPLSGPDPGDPAYGNLLVSRLPLASVEHLRFPPAGGGEQRTALLVTIQVGSRPVTVAAGHLSNKQGHNVRQLRELQGLAGSRAAPRLLVGDLNMPSTVLVFASRRGWRETGRGRTWPNSAVARILEYWPLAFYPLPSERRSSQLAFG